jgi:hypothetical protein
MPLHGSETTSVVDRPALQSKDNLPLALDAHAPIPTVRSPATQVLQLSTWQAVNLSDSGAVVETEGKGQHVNWTLYELQQLIFGQLDRSEVPTDRNRLKLLSSWTRRHGRGKELEC